MRTRRIILAGFVARLKATRLPKCVTGEGAGYVGGQKKESMGCFLDDFRSFDIHAHQCTTEAQDKGE